MGDVEPVASANEEAIEAWNGVLFDRFVQFRQIVTDGLGAHGEEAPRLQAPQPGKRALAASTWIVTAIAPAKA